MEKYFILLLAGLFIFGCQKDEPDAKKFGFVKPAHFPEPYYTFDKNPVTREGFELGKKLFGDPILSIDRSVACNNCHVKAVAFTDPQHRLSLGVDERSGTRNAPPVQNMAFMKEFFWDGGGVHLDFVPPNAIENELEMDEDLAHVVWKLNRSSGYSSLFRHAFPEMGDSITAPYLLQALSQYQVMLISASSRYDQYILGQVGLTTEELSGMELFREKCSSCHSGQLFTDQDFHNNGLDSIFADEGRGRITESALDLGKFKTPSLRNVALTDPYMHDGRFNSLEEVMEHYTSGVLYSSTLDPELLKAGNLGIPMSDNEKQAIILFLHTLTDYSFISNPDF